MTSSQQVIRFNGQQDRQYYVTCLDDTNHAQLLNSTTSNPPHPTIYKPSFPTISNSKRPHPTIFKPPLQITSKAPYPTIFSPPLPIIYEYLFRSLSDLCFQHPPFRWREVGLHHSRNSNVSTKWSIYITPIRNILEALFDGPTVSIIVKDRFHFQ